ncbi:hypothetical protein BDN72DRAFT_903848 [Pluteus cervinus]|uniref:Uncharacterized protein n=1 Tax=Pluteus cervinus TaxID=181527 RepID=A0ACD3AA80_9AGAR|nr:hypothetical protein BDN72DRAFT_903848 [Pluteus cervinus]
MAPKRKTTDRQTAFLNLRKLEYKAAQAQGKLKAFWITLYRKWFKKWPSGTKEETDGWKERLKVWFRNNTRQNGPAPQSIYPKKCRRLLHPVELYMKKYYKTKIESRVDEAMKDKGVKLERRMAVTRDIARELFDNEEESVQTEIFEELDRLKAKMKAEKVPGVRTPATMAAAIESLPALLNLHFRDLCTATGWSFVVVGAGPDPIMGGSIGVNTTYVGEANRGKNNFKACVDENGMTTQFLEFIRHIYSDEECGARAYDPTKDSTESGDESGDEEEEAGQGGEHEEDDSDSDSSDSSDEDMSTEADVPPLPTPVIDVIANGGAIERPVVAPPIPFVSSNTPAVQPSASTEAAPLQASNQEVPDHLTANELQALMLASTSNTSQWGLGNVSYTNDASFAMLQNSNTDINVFTTPQGSLSTLLSSNDWAMEGQGVQGFNAFLAGDVNAIDWSAIDFGTFGMDSSSGFDTPILQSNHLGTFSTPPTSAFGDPPPMQGPVFTPTPLPTATAPGHPTQTTFIFPPTDSSATPISVPAPPAPPSKAPEAPPAPPSKAPEAPHAPPSKAPESIEGAHAGDSRVTPISSTTTSSQTTLVLPPAIPVGVPAPPAAAPFKEPVSTKKTKKTKKVTPKPTPSPSPSTPSPPVQSNLVADEPISNEKSAKRARRPAKSKEVVTLTEQPLKKRKTAKGPAALSSD